ncbi:ABC transporter substrate-binding protein [Nakamurella aerolata]|uniref:ABC transporter substrate-binding protein n=1 Tax=Nakamurella aerolata TaxID=1656892 RepID=A0A849A2N3_9ACTN|nr:ABC transporter substrate-binding protein [Nakamurella aerolata]NNG34337.1 ABC transporter substrate-binding protein [Nakamurella aerolata]
MNRHESSPPAATPRRRRLRFAAGALAAALVVTACGAGSSTQPASTAPATTATATTDGQATAGQASNGAGGGSVGSQPGAGASGSDGSAAPAPSGDPNATLNVGFVAAPASLDFTQDSGAAIPQALLYNVYETLVRMTPTGEIAPLLASKWTVSDDQKVYTFTLRDNAKFSNGAAFTAEDAVFSINRVKSDWAKTVAVAQGMSTVAKAEAVNPTTLRVTLTKPSQSWLFSMTTRIGAMFSRTGVAELATKAVGTGPYLVSANQPNVKLTLTRNPDYWGTKAGMQTVNFMYYKDPTAMNNAELSRAINVISSVQTPDQLDQFGDTAKYQIIEGTTTGEVLLSFNNSKAPLNNKNVRQAISYAIDRKGLLDTVWAGKGALIGSHAVPTDPWYTDLANTYPYDPAKAKELLGGKTYTLRLRVPNLPYATAAAPVIASQLQQVGITVKVDTLDFPADWLTQVFTNADYDMSIVNHVEPNDLATLWGNPEYYTRYDNPEVQKLLADGDAGTRDQMIADYRKATEILADDAAGVWLWAFPNLLVADVDVKGLAKNQVSESFDLTGVSVG